MSECFEERFGVCRHYFQVQESHAQLFQLFLKLLIRSADEVVGCAKHGVCAFTNVSPPGVPAESATNFGESNVSELSVAVTSVGIGGIFSSRLTVTSTASLLFGNASRSLAVRCRIEITRPAGAPA